MLCRLIQIDCALRKVSTFALLSGRSVTEGLSRPISAHGRHRASTSRTRLGLVELGLNCPRMRGDEFPLRMPTYIHYCVMLQRHVSEMRAPVCFVRTEISRWCGLVRVYKLASPGRPRSTYTKLEQSSSQSTSLYTPEHFYLCYDDEPARCPHACEHMHPPRTPTFADTSS